jgi:hypothetical protein
MIKRSHLLAAFLVLSFLPVHGKAINVGIGASYFYPLFESQFAEIYGGGLKYGGIIGVDIWKNLGLCAGGSYFSKKGELTFTKEETKLTLVGFDICPMYKFTSGKWQVYAAMGLRYILFQESNVLGEVKKGGLGPMGKIGVFLNVFKGLTIEFFLDIASCSMQPADFKINIGGIDSGIRFGFQF